ncbi:MAG: sigma-70 family RNA polymerase sigma factor [Deltaproteobacteria bacterium]
MWKRLTPSRPVRSAPSEVAVGDTVVRGSLAAARAESDADAAGTEPPTDPLAQLARQAATGDHAAANALLTQITPALLRVARQILGPQHAEVNDVTQEAACGLLLALPRFRGECTVVHFACRVAMLVAMNVRRREQSHTRKTETLSSLSDVYPVTALPPTPEDRLLGERAAGAIRLLLGSLPEAQAEVLGLHHVVGLTMPEIAAVTRAPLETVRSRLRLGRHAVRQRVLGDQRLLEQIGGSNERDR